MQTKSSSRNASNGSASSGSGSKAAASSLRSLPAGKVRQTLATPLAGDDNNGYARRRGAVVYVSMLLCIRVHVAACACACVHACA